ncbi:MAG: hypothetical protein U1F43_33645 [Myxococcota bacterium]
MSSPTSFSAPRIWRSLALLPLLVPFVGDAGPSCGTKRPGRYEAHCVMNGPLEGALGGTAIGDPMPLAEAQAYCLERAWCSGISAPSADGPWTARQSEAAFAPTRGAPARTWVRACE